MLAEPVVESCDWIEATAPWTCRGTPTDNCSWYHGSWQYLRLLNLVSNPAWHTDFLVAEIAEIARRVAKPRVLIAGCADYSSYAHVIAVLGCAAEVIALDWCRTPLISTAWYARRQGLAAPAMVVEDATRHRPAEAYDLIITDSFLPRFPPSELAELIRTWRATIRPGGVIITTVRIHDEQSTAAIRTGDQTERWRSTALRSAPWWPAVSRLPVPELAAKAAEFVRRQERNAVYAMSELSGLFTAAGFADFHGQQATVNDKPFARLVITG